MPSHSIHVNAAKKKYCTMADTTLHPTCMCIWNESMNWLGANSPGDSQTYRTPASHFHEEKHKQAKE